MPDPTTLRRRLEFIRRDCQSHADLSFHVRELAGIVLEMLPEAPAAPEVAADNTPKAIFSRLLCFLAGRGFATPVEGYHDIDHVISDLHRHLIQIAKDGARRERETCAALMDALRDQAATDLQAVRACAFGYAANAIRARSGDTPLPDATPPTR